MRDGAAICHVVGGSWLCYLDGEEMSNPGESLCFLLVARYAKERKLRIWRDYVAPTANLDQKDKQFVAKVRAVRAVGGRQGMCWCV